MAFYTDIKLSSLLLPQYLSRNILYSWVFLECIYIGIQLFCLLSSLWSPPALWFNLMKFLYGGADVLYTKTSYLNQQNSTFLVYILIFIILLPKLSKTKPLLINNSFKSTWKTSHTASSFWWPGLLKWEMYSTHFYYGHNFKFNFRKKAKNC